MPAPKRRSRRGFGRIEQRGPKRFRAAYIGPDKQLHRAVRTFESRQDAEMWLAARYKEMSEGHWRAPGPTGSGKGFEAYALKWVETRKVHGEAIKPRTKEHYGKLLDQHILPTFGEMPLTSISRESVVAWYESAAIDRPTLRKHAYGLLKSILKSATLSGDIAFNPCTVENATSARRVSKTEPATLEELEGLVGASPEQFRLMILFASWCALRYGELTELRRKDIDVKNGVVKVRRGVVRVGGEYVVGKPKSEAGIRDVAIPPHLMPSVKRHLEEFAQPGKEGLLFPSVGGSHLPQSSMHKWFSVARGSVGRPDMRFHDLRHLGAVLAAQTGASLAELMDRLGHSTPAAAMRYQHAAKGRDRQIAEAMSKMAEK